MLPDSERAELESEKCNKCSTTFLTAYYDPKNSPFPGSSYSYTGCFICDPILRDLIVTKAYRDKKNKEFKPLKALKDAGGAKV